MGTFDFSSFGSINTPSDNNYLRPWNVYDLVEFDGISEPVSGTRQDGTAWKAWDFKFKSPKGIYSERLFEPDENGIKRRTFKGANGNEVEFPSDFERSQQVIAQVVAAYNPAGFEKLKTVANSGKIKTFEQFINLVKELLKSPIKPTEEHNIQLKLIGRTDSKGATYARLPNCALSKQDGTPFMEKFIGENVYMTNWELGQQEAYNKKKPSNPDTSNPISAVDSTPTQEVGVMDDINSLLS